MIVDRFTGRILGAGTSRGVRLVVGRWDDSPWGPFADVMVAEPSGRRILLAPDDRVADYVSQTYSFDEVRTGPVTVQGEDAWVVQAPGLELRVRTGARAPLGWLLQGVPRALATSPAWARLTDPIARRVLQGVRTRGSAGNGRTETYGAYDLRGVLSLVGTWQGDSVGELAPVSPEPGFGFGSTPEAPSVTSLVTTVVRPD
ncbi:hypothetical protein KLP28_00145 [Nocardioidaceae bacterium]|nr:hypothetical protein KLP28_00145 [Nocardioidaceae bacterium]